MKNFTVKNLKKYKKSQIVIKDKNMKNILDHSKINKDVNYNLIKEEREV